MSVGVLLWLGAGRQEVRLSPINAPSDRRCLTTPRTVLFDTLKPFSHEVSTNIVPCKLKRVMSDQSSLGALSSSLSFG